MNLIEFLERFGIPFKREGEHHHVTRGWYGVDCPFCNSAPGNAKLGFNLESRGVSCWTCGRHKFSEAIEALVQKPWKEVSPLLDWTDRLFQFTPSRNLRQRLVLPKGLGPLSPAHRDYLAGRGFDPDELVKLWGLRGIGLAAKLAWRIFIPATYRGETVSWTTRGITEAEPRYLNASPEQEKMSLKSLLVGEEYVRNAIIVTEGPFDAIRIGPGAVSLCGIKFTQSQIARIAKYPVRVIAFDSDPVAQERARELCQELCGFVGKTSRVELDAADPGEATKREVTKLRKRFLD